MRTLAQLGAVDPLNFGRRGAASAAARPRSAFSEDARLFLSAFAAGFLFLSIFLA